MKRYRAKKSVDKRYFSKTASQVNKKNINPNPLRGGYRL